MAKNRHNKEAAIIDNYITEIMGLMGKNNFDQFFFEELEKPTVTLPMKPFVDVMIPKKSKNMEFEKKTMFLRDHAQITMNINKQKCDAYYFEKVYYLQFFIKSIDMRHFKNSVAIQVEMCDIPYKDDDYLKEHIRIDKDGYIDVKQCSFPLEVLSNIHGALLNQLPKV